MKLSGAPVVAGQFGSWTPLGAGLPERNGYFTVLRDAFCADTLDPAGLYFGTRGGQLYGSSDEGESWRAIAEYLPPASEDGVLDDDTIFWEIFEGEPSADGGFIHLPETPGLGVELNAATIQSWSGGNTE